MPIDKNKDLELWHNWNKTKSIVDLEILIKQMQPILKRESSRWSNIVSPFILENEAKKIALKTFEKFNPNAGVQLSTFLVEQLQKLSRLAYEHQNTLSIPEHQRLIFNRYNNIKKQFEDDHGRIPTHEELADQLAISSKKLSTMIENVGQRELIETGEGLFLKDVPDDIMDLAFHDLTPLQKEIFKLKTGYEGTPIARSATEIQKKLGISQGQLSYELLKIKKLFEQANKLRP